MDKQEDQGANLALEAAQNKHRELFLLACEHDGFDPASDTDFPFTDGNPYRDALDASWRAKRAALEAVMRHEIRSEG